MGDVHRLILKHGLEGARNFASTKAERFAIEAAASMLADASLQAAKPISL